ncbi:HNH endonuclease [Rosenbergiella collisarenosi]|uniref:HNH endonuclease n=1 Tax=Rosenbergiella collisarenosi TaxID=1544695 RepID=UPI001BD9DA27|nr:HNH endonuclease [Rosenbergiella collisarenosi]MBT0721392.1 HNH endonuclease [Rosenbergiella collisarenosi]
MRFYQQEPTRENYWRGIILFGKNVASYKFALANALYDINSSGNELIRLEDLALPYSQHICRHLQGAPKQITSRSSTFLDACLQFNQGEITQEALINTTLRYGFANVIDKFHNVNRAEIDCRFYLDERKTEKSIRLTDNFFHLTESPQYKNIGKETEARWRLVESAWELNISQTLLDVHYDPETKGLYTAAKTRRKAITSCRASLNGYQKGKCFYCYAPIHIVSCTKDGLADVDHFIPWIARSLVPNIDGIWNLVLACQQCNRGVGGKFEKLPGIKLLERLHQRNEYFINSHLPLRETLIRQTGKTEVARKDFLSTAWNTVLTNMSFTTWAPQAAAEDTF